MASTFNLTFILLTSIVLVLNLTQLSHATSDDDLIILGPTIEGPRPQAPFNGNFYDKKPLIPTNPLNCMPSFSKAGVCLTDVWANQGKPSTACCQALKEIDTKCLAALMPLLNPYIGQFLQGACAIASGGASGGSVFPVPPFHFPTPGSGGLPFLPFPFPSTPGDASGGAFSPPPHTN